jgi:hypothetical protein
MPYVDAPAKLDDFTGQHQRGSPGWSESAERHANRLWFQMLGVEAHSFFPHDQKKDALL